MPFLGGASPARRPRCRPLTLPPPLLPAFGVPLGPVLRVKGGGGVGRAASPPPWPRPAQPGSLIAGPGPTFSRPGPSSPPDRRRADPSHGVCRSRRWPRRRGRLRRLCGRRRRCRHLRLGVFVFSVGGGRPAPPSRSGLSPAGVVTFSAEGTPACCISPAHPSPSPAPSPPRPAPPPLAPKPRAPAGRPPPTSRCGPHSRRGAGLGRARGSWN